MYSAGNVHPSPQPTVLGHYRICSCKYILYKCIKFTQDATYHVIQIDQSLRITTASCQNGSLMVCLLYTNFSFNKQTHLNGLRGYFQRSCNLVHIVSLGIYCSVLEWGGGREGGLISNLNSVRLRFTAASWKKGVFMLCFIFHRFCINSLDMPHWITGKFHRSYNLAHTVSDWD